MSQLAPDQAVLKIANLQNFITVLQAIKSSNSKQVCAVLLTEDGLSVRWEDDSKSLQSSVFLSTQIFAGYHCPWARKMFGITFSQLLDTLGVFQSSKSSSDLVLKFPSANEELICEMMEESSETTTICTFAHIDSKEILHPCDIGDYWEEPSSYFLISGTLLKEAIEDLEWAAGNGSMTLSLQQDPPSIALSAHGMGDLEVKLPVDSLAAFKCEQPTVQHKYKFRHLRAAVSNLPKDSKDANAQVSTKVMIDSQGLIKVTHMMNLQGMPRTQGGVYDGLAAFAQSQRAISANMGVVQFMTIPEESGLNDDDL